MKAYILLQNSNNMDRKIWITLPTSKSEIDDAINDICKNNEDTYIINNIKSDITPLLQKFDDIYEINRVIKILSNCNYSITKDNKRLKLTPEERIITEKKKLERMRICNLVKRYSDIDKHCCICGSKNTQILHNEDNSFLIAFICKKCRADKSKLTQAKKLRFDIREKLDKSKMSTKTFSEKDVKELVENYLFDILSIEAYCDKIGISRYKFNQIIEKYKIIFNDNSIRKQILNHANKINALKLSALALERNRFKHRDI